MLKLLSDLKRFFANVSAVPKMAAFEQVHQHVPHTAQYVTLSSVVIVDDPSSSIMAVQQQHQWPISGIASAEGRPMTVAYMVHDGQNFSLISAERELLSVPLKDITVLDRAIGGGFVFHLRDGRGIGFTTPTPVQTGSDAWYRTIQGITDMTGGWLKELEPYSVRVVH